jgi:hypothetical protein
MSGSDPVHALPLSRRVKSYSAESGFVYQYIFAGKSGSAHVFEVSVDRKQFFLVQVDLQLEALAACEAKLGSPLRWNDEYALAKLALFQAFDTREDADALRIPFRPTTTELIGYMKVLKMVDEDE